MPKRIEHVNRNREQVHLPQRFCSRQAAQAAEIIVSEAPKRAKGAHSASSDWSPSAAIAGP
jgi:hypothetical protein